ncbi:phospholipid/cholesterol/gamma-HCH transport system ATP-binding protein [Desulfacinum hydrothermale DSM 13146]|uniref:Phospholipid/cholesterol/gamma-HCH transport system ATP-binding protein n=1 Tax=Desulfacinum hydrothermale DSM 13146 TaxID=1121390 RepID=A0A1W1X109_9BACT|nr:ATP-binding cassette domain-containing protein [Desulfacinum hydrothermale]SMC17594.1 phospholipid/cholesterol/gamma-HCH transport system ATP-binding protein [Desulfacinum hydrothermale DSM 13146]
MAETEAGAIIQVKSLNSFYGQRRVLQDISFEVPAGKVTVIMGVSGCGKSTLLRHLIGLKPTDPGQIFVEGRDLAGFDARQMEAFRKRIGVLFQAGALFNSMSVRDNIAVPLRVHTRLAEPTISIMVRIKLHQVGLTRFGDYMPSQLSGGMRKRAGLARALAMDPEMLFVDEPSSGLDPITAAGLDDLILELREAMGMTLIVVTHELESAFRIADQLIVLDQGRVLAAGMPESIRESRDERVVQFLTRRADERTRDQEGYLSDLLTGGRKVGVHP